MDLYLFFLASIFGITAYVVYYQDTRKSSIKPNRWSWLIWGFTTAVEVWTYQAVSNNWLTTAVFFISAVSCIAITALVWRRSVWKTPEWHEIVTVILSVCAVITLIVFHQAWWAHVIAVIAIPLSFVPTYKEAWDNWSHEDSPSWVLWTIGDTLAFIYVLMRFDSLEELPYAAVEALSHGAMWVIVAWRGRRAATHRINTTARILGKTVLVALVSTIGLTAAYYCYKMTESTENATYVFFGVLVLSATIFVGRAIARAK